MSLKYHFNSTDDLADFFDAMAANTKSQAEKETRPKYKGLLLREHYTWLKASIVTRNAVIGQSSTNIVQLNPSAKPNPKGQ